MWALGCLRWRNPLTSVLFYPLALRGGCSRALLTSPSPRNNRGLALFSYFSPPGTDVSVLHMMGGRLPESFCPGPVRYNVTMEEEFFPRGSIYTQCDVTSISCTRGCWEIECLDDPFVHLGQKQPWKAWQNRVLTVLRYILKGTALTAFTWRKPTHHNHTCISFAVCEFKLKLHMVIK